MTTPRPSSSRRWMAIGAGVIALIGLGIAGGYQALTYYGERRAEAALQQLNSTLPAGYGLTWAALRVDPFRQTVTLDNAAVAAPQFTIPVGRVTVGDVRTDGDLVTRAKIRIEPGPVDLVAFARQPSLIAALLGAPLRWGAAAGYDVVEPVISIGFDYSASDSKVGITLGLDAEGFGAIQLGGVLDRVTPAVLAAVRQIATAGPAAGGLDALSGVGFDRIEGSMEDRGFVARMALLRAPQAVYAGGDLAKQTRDELARSGLSAEEQAAVVRFAMGAAPSLTIQGTARTDAATVGAALAGRLPSGPGAKTFAISN